ncbi:GNAT family N-acetyltransferase [Clostridium isatidis]|uniref:GNAT family N-acetyltransferase n=1 Tax=Clostridium isatidis TaxID=182773 RepID=UPI002688A7F2
MILDKELITYKIKNFNDLSIDEFYEIAKVRYEVFVCEQVITCENDFDDKDKEAYHLLVCYKDKLIGYCRILKAGVSYDAPSIGRVLILKEYRGSGIAKEMMKKAMDFIFYKLEENEIKLSAQLYVRNLYEALGFEAVSDIYEEAGIDHIKMHYIK